MLYLSYNPKYRRFTTTAKVTEALDDDGIRYAAHDEDVDLLRRRGRIIAQRRVCPAQCVTCGRPYITKMVTLKCTTCRGED